MWTDRNTNDYCVENDSTHLHQPIDAYGVVANYRPVVHIMKLSPSNDRIYRKEVMSLLLAHEIAHTFGMYEIYNEYSHDIDNPDYKDCIMNTFDPRRFRAIYESMSSDKWCFCDNCKDTMSELIKGKIHYGN